VEKYAHQNLIDTVVSYFQGYTPDVSELAGTFQRVNRTLAPPIYLQRPGHSLTIVGVEFQTNGIANLVVLDPQFNTTPLVRNLLEHPSRSLHGNPDPELMDVYRLPMEKLQPYNEFEVLM